MSEPRFEVVVFGATSFVGKIMTRYLLQRHGSDGKSVRWAIAGRSRSRLEALRQELGAADLPLLLADSGDEASLRALCAETRVVATTVGPYALYGEPLVRVCAESGTDYCDLTGEVPWIRRMIDRYHHTAAASGARILHCAGFDSVPSDLGVWHLQQEALRRFGAACPRVRLRIRAMRGGASGGTVASLMNVLRESAADPEVRRVLSNPHALCPPEARKGPRQPGLGATGFDPVCDSVIAPFVMAAINTRIVHRSNALLGHAWGEDFVYDEAMMTGKGIKGRVAGLALTSGLGAFVGAAALPPTRWLLERFVVPKPGEGPSPEAQEKGFYDFRFFGETAAGERLSTRVTGDRDPGYGSTSKILGEVAVCMAQDAAVRDKPGGSWTPSALCDGALLERLRAHAGLAFSVLD